MVVTSKMNSASLPPARPDSEQLVDLHVYRVPPDVWNEKYQSAYNEVINETISIGFVRVWPELTIWNLREELRNQLGPASLPEEFVYVRSVGRCLTQVKARQELELKVKAFLPPKNFAPEIFILEGAQDVPDTAFIEATKEVAVSTMEVDEEESIEEKGMASRKAKKVTPKSVTNSKETVKAKLPSRILKGSKVVGSDKNYNEKWTVASKLPTKKAKESERSNTGQTMTMTELKALQKRETELKKPRSNRLTPRVGKASVVKGPVVDKNVKAITPLKKTEVSNVRQVKGREALIESLTSRVSQKTVKPSNLKMKQEGSKKRGTLGHVTFSNAKVSDTEREPHLTTPSAVTHGLSKLQSPRKEARPETFTKNTNSDSGLGEQTPEETQDRILRGSEGPQIFESTGDSFRQDHHANQFESRPFVGADEGQRHPNLYQEESPRSYQQNQNFPSRTQRDDWGPPPPPIHRDQSDYYDDRGPQGGQSAMHPVHGTYQDLSPRGGNYEQGNRPVDSLSNQEKLFTPRTQRDGGIVQNRGYNPHFNGGTTSRYSDKMQNQQGHPYSYDSPRGHVNQAEDTEEAMAYLQLSNEGATQHDKQQLRYGSPSELDPEKPVNPEKQRLLNQVREEQQERLGMEKMREELIKKAKMLQGKTIDRRKKARDYWKKRYYDEKKKTPSLEEQVAKLASQVQQQNRKLMNHLEGKGSKAPKGPPSKRMDHKIQIFRHQHAMEDLKRQVDNARMKLATEIKLRTQAETELRVLKSEVIQKKINVTLKRGKQLQAIQKSEDKIQGRTPLPKGAGGSSI